MFTWKPHTNSKEQTYQLKSVCTFNIYDSIALNNLPEFVYILLGNDI